jgi:hypothetical protein
MKLSFEMVDGSPLEGFEAGVVEAGVGADEPLAPAK